MKLFTQGKWLAAVVLVTTSAGAHVSLVSGPGFADTNQEITLGVGHGCAGMDTSSVRVELPAAVTAARAVPSTFGRATVETNAAGIVTAVTWQKSPADLLEGDTGYYRLTLRIRVPNQPFTKLLFPARQTCSGRDGGTATVDWIAESSAGSEEPAPELLILPPRKPGWNKVTISQAGIDLASYFGDAMIVWKGQSAYSSNPATAQLIAATSGVTPLTALGVGDEIWVKY